MIQKRPMPEPQALKKLADLCAKGEHCSGEMLEKMRRWGLAEDAQARIMEKTAVIRSFSSTIKSVTTSGDAGR